MWISKCFRTKYMAFKLPSTSSPRPVALCSLRYHPLRSAPQVTRLFQIAHYSTVYALKFPNFVQKSWYFLPKFIRLYTFALCDTEQPFGVSVISQPPRRQVQGPPVGTPRLISSHANDEIRGRRCIFAEFHQRSHNSYSSP